MIRICIIQGFYTSAGFEALSTARWPGKHTYVSSLGMLGTTQLNFLQITYHLTMDI